MIALSLPSFDGPLDLLLELVRQHRYPLDRLPLGEITRQFHSYIKEAEEAEIDLGGEFIETASWLVLLKSRSLLPAAPGTELPEQELGRILLDHQTLRATTWFLETRMEEAGLTAARADQERKPFAGEFIAAAAPTLNDALMAARRALETARVHAGTPAPPPDAYPLDKEIKRLFERLASLPFAEAISTEKWFREEPEAAVSLFLALLELARLKQVLLRQVQDFGPILLKRIPGGDHDASFHAG
jgi:segregation and condensation protein A